MRFVITGIGVVSPFGIGREIFWQKLEKGESAVKKISSFDTSPFSVKVAAELKDFDPASFLGKKGLRNLDRSSLFLLVAAKLALEDRKLEINEKNTDKIGVATATTFSHFWPIVEFDKEIFEEGIDFASPALFPLTVMSAPSSAVSIRYNIQGFNTTVSSGFPSAIDALNYSFVALATNKAELVLSCAVETLNFYLFFGLHKLKYMAGINGPLINCPYDKRRNGPVLGEGAVVLIIEDEKRTKKEKTKIYAKINGVGLYFDSFHIGKIHPQGQGLEEAIKKAMEKAGISLKDIDCIFSCANSSYDLDKIEIKVLKKIFGKNLNKIPVTSIKSMIGESFSASAGLQIVAAIGALLRGVIPPTINYKEKDPDCYIDSLVRKPLKKDIKRILITSFGPGGYNGACILEKYVGGN